MHKNKSGGVDKNKKFANSMRQCADALYKNTTYLNGLAPAGSAVRRVFNGNYIEGAGNAHAAFSIFKQTYNVRRTADKIRSATDAFEGKGGFWGKNELNDEEGQCCPLSCVIL